MENLFLPPPRKIDLKGFTLAEVLITLAIIGIIAAITIPGVVAEHKKRTLETQFAKSYRTLSQAVNMAIAEHGDISTWGWKNGMTNEEKDAFVKKYILSYLNVIKFCPKEGDDRNCFPDTVYKYLNGTNYLNYRKDSAPQAILGDGSIIAMSFNDRCYSIAKTERCMTIIVDINGGKKPNTLGRDVQRFAFFPKTGEFLPDGINVQNEFNEETGSYRKRPLEELVTYFCNTSQADNSAQCAARVVMEGFKMNY